MIAIINYEMGNLRSVQKALQKLGHAAEVTDDPAEIAAAEKLILPGVGAYADAMTALRQRDLVEPLKRAIAAGKPTLGICLGLQLLFEKSSEGGEHEGLGILPGEVVRFNIPREYKVPHMGWNQINRRRRTPIFTGIDDGAYFYFVHSYYVVPRDESIIATTTDYPTPFTSSIWRENLFAVQFHPEKSQQLGLRLLENFAGL